jgi:glyoxylase-like metal-dependent hydrolase (beta-lactamase superfamily II)
VALPGHTGGSTAYLFADRGLDAQVVLPGHGEPFTGGSRAAADQARAVGPH